MDLPRNTDGTLQAFAFPGGYPIYYVMADGGCLCPDCANGKNHSLAGTAEDHTPDPYDGQWTIVGADVHWEGAPFVCDHCGAMIESAYGIPDSE